MFRIAAIIGLAAIVTTAAALAFTTKPAACDFSLGRPAALIDTHVDPDPSKTTFDEIGALQDMTAYNEAQEYQATCH